jgi:hypothetical protein
MAKREVDNHYLKTSAVRAEPRRYSSLADVLAAMKDLIQLQNGRGFNTVRDDTGKHTSRHPDGRVVQFWAEDRRGAIVS